MESIIYNEAIPQRIIERVEAEIEAKKEKKFAKMNVAINKACKEWDRLTKVRREFEKIQEDLKKRGLWDEFCSRDNGHGEGWDTELKFGDFGA